MYTYVTTFGQLGSFVTEIQNTDAIGFDIETTGTDPFTSEILLMQVKLNPTTYVLDARKLGEKVCRYITQLLLDSNKILIGHNIKFEIKMVKSHYNELLLNVYDTMLAEILITNGLAKGEEKYFSLNDLTEKYCGITLDKSIRENFYKVENPEITEQELIYASMDVEFLLKIREEQLKKLAEQKQVQVIDLENKLLPVIASMELEGVLIDEGMWHNLEGKYVVEAGSLRKQLIDEIFEKVMEVKFANALDLVDFLEITEGAKSKKDRQALSQITDITFVIDRVKEMFNLNSSNQLLAVFQKVYKIKIDSTNEKIINKFEVDNPIISKLLKYREFAKSVSTYGSKFLLSIHPKTGRIHTEFNQLGMVSGRISSEKPNLLNIKKESEYRNAFVARPGKKIISADFSQEELRVLAVIAMVKGMIDAFKNGIDLHLKTASGLFKISLNEVTKEQRYKGKTMNFAVGYGSSEYGLWKNFGIPMEEGKQYLKAFYGEIYPEIDACKNSVGKRILELGYSTTLFGRKRFFEIPTFFPGGARERDRIIAAILREGFNHIIQGTCADVLKKTLIGIFYENPFGNKLKILIQIYDEVVCEVDDDVAEEAKKFVEGKMIGCLREYLRDVIPAEVDAKLGTCWLH